MKNKNKTYWLILVSLFFASVIFLVVIGNGYLPSYPDSYTVVVPRHDNRDLSILNELDNTPMVDAKHHIANASEYYGIPLELYLGIAFAESSFKNYRCYNPWGIDTGKGNDPRCYSSWEHSVNGFSQLIKYYYLEEGLVSPEGLVRKYVGWYNPDWVRNVSTYYQGTCR